MKDVTWIDNLKLKASYGAVGNDNLTSWYCYFRACTPPVTTTCPTRAW